MRKILAVWSLGVFAASSLAGAHGHHREPAPEWPSSRVCIVPAAHTDLVAQRVLEWRGECEEVPLTFTRVTRSYPAMDGLTLTVDAWTGGYARLALVEKTYRTTEYGCSETRVREFRVGPREERLSFPIENPNLRDTVSASFEANAPLTDAEAIAAMIPARAACEAATVMP